ncbi:Chitinase, partial [hydrothermal vent metagenome]
MSITRGRILQRCYRKLFIIGLSLVGAAFITGGPAYGVVYSGNPQNLKSQLEKLEAGDTLLLEAGVYKFGLSIADRHGDADNPIIITGPETGDPAIFLGDTEVRRNTIQIRRSSYLTFRHLKIDGLDVDGIDAVNSTGITHHITLEHLEIVRHGGGQLTVGIATRGPAWDWVIRNCKIIGAGTGMYLGDSRGTRWPFVGGLIEHNLIVDTVGYNVQFKHTISRTDVNGNVIPGMPQEKRKTIIRHNVFSKANQPTDSIVVGPRPNLLVGHFPLSGPGSDDVYEIYGNFFYENTTDEPLFQGEGNIALYDNVFVNSSGDAVNIQPHNDVPRNINVFHNTVVATGNGIGVWGADINFAQRVAGNAIFAGKPTPVSANSKVVLRDNVTAAYAAASDYLMNPGGSLDLGELDLFPLVGKLLADSMDMTAFQGFSDWDLDFNQDTRNGTYRGAYASEGSNTGWGLAIDFKPRGEVVPQAPSITNQPEPLTVTEGEDASFSVASAGSRPLTYQWYFNGVEISETNSASYMLTAVSVADAGTYGCIVTNDQGSDSCVDATLIVSADALAPTLVTASATSATGVDILFSEAVSAASAETSANYQLDLGINIDTASLNADERTVSLTVTPALTEDSTYEVSVSNVQDRAQTPNTIVNLSSKTFTYRTIYTFEGVNPTGDWTPLNPGNWEVKADAGDMAYYINSSSSPGNSLLGEYSLLPGSYGDFTLTAQARLDATGANADYAVVFGFQNADNYYYALFNNNQAFIELFKVFEGTRTALDLVDPVDTDWLNDNAYHAIKVSREGSEIKVYFDDNLIMHASDSTFGVGQVGIGSFNDSAYFDDVQVVGEVTTTPDTTPPMITLTGNNPQTITVGNTYIELGATATDNVDGDINPDNITVDASAVDTNTVGSYSVTYNVSDEANNPAIEVTRTVNITAVVNGDNVAPVITLMGNNPQTITVGNTYTELGATATDNVDGDINPDNITVDASAVDTNTVGSYSVTYNVSDEANNPAIEVTRTVNITAVVNDDNVAPVITLMGNNPQAITVGSAYTDLGAMAMDNIDGNLTTNIQTVNLVDTANPGTYEVTYNVSDAAGNVATEVVRTVNVIT